ncbi:hypothetical protein [Isoptericola sp. NPDC057191]|uniref:hypothetical protein n=1 Tax=Isoptericola sp. NPDC057191 TaxID=3346041 RepID=UPI003642811A
MTLVLSGAAVRVNTGRLLTRSPSSGEAMDTSIAKNAPSATDVALPDVLELAAA